MIVNKGGNKIVRVIITRLQPQKQWNISNPACLFKLVGQQLIVQKLVILPLHKSSSKLEQDKGEMHSNKIKNKAATATKEFIYKQNRKKKNLQIFHFAEHAYFIHFLFSPTTPKELQHSPLPVNEPFLNLFHKFQVPLI